VQLHPTAKRYRQIQKALADKGYYHGKIDGKWGPVSISALQRFQTKQGLENEGKITALALIGLGLGPKHTHTIMPVIPVSPAQTAEDPDTSEAGQESRSLLPGNGVTVNP
jgi:peptidoglycan hydrolase-like protein with peptidoglycan-binding domain